MNVSLTPELERRVRDLVDSGLYASASEVVRSALRQMPELVSMREQLLDEMTLEAIREADRGLIREMTPEVWDEIVAESDRMLAENEPIPWYITGEEP